MYKTCAAVIAGLAALGLLMWALVGPDVEGIPTRIRPYGEGAFLVFPKYRGNMYSLARQSGDEVVPYPNRHVHEKGVITNAVDIHLDSRGTLWVLDSGVIRTLGKPVRKSGPRVLALDADTGVIKQTVPLDGLVRGRAQFLEVEESLSGPVRLYVSDGPARCIAVWDVVSGKGRRLLLPRAVSHPSDVLYLALVEPSSLYFTYYRSPDMYVVDTKEVAEGRGVVRRVGSKPPGVVIIGREGKHILFRVSGAPGTVYSWDTGSGLSRRSFVTRDVGGRGDSLHAVADIGKTWVLEADLSAFLSGKKVQHRIRTIHRPSSPNNKTTTARPHHRGIRPTDLAPPSNVTTSPASQKCPERQTDTETTTPSSALPARDCSMSGGSENYVTTIGKTTEATAEKLQTAPPVCRSARYTTTAKPVKETTVKTSAENALTTSLKSAISSKYVTTISPTTEASVEATTTAEKLITPAPTRSAARYITTVKPITEASDKDSTTENMFTPSSQPASAAKYTTIVSPTTEANVEATTTAEKLLTPPPTAIHRDPDVRLIPAAL